jgi:hypothetical protein
MLNVIMGEGVSVNVVKDDTVMPLKLGGVPQSGDGAVDVATTTEWGIARMSFRRWDESGGSSVVVAFLASSSTALEV